MGEAKRRRLAGSGFKAPRLDARLLKPGESLTDWQETTFDILKTEGKNSGCHAGFISKNGSTQAVIIRFFVAYYRGDKKFCADFMMPRATTVRLNQKETDILSRKLCLEQIESVDLIIA